MGADAPRSKPGPPRKRFGQHFLTDTRALERIVEAVAPDEVDCLVEIGPGRGALTSRLLARARRLVAVEIDRDLVRHLREEYAGNDRVQIVEGDALEVDWRPASGSWRLAGNLPYYITTPLVFRILEAPRPDRAVLLVQKEVADRLGAAPGSPDYGALSVNVQVVSRVTVVSKVPAGAFHPRPQVDSAIVRLDPLTEPLVPPDEEAGFRRFVVALFGMRRKQLVRSLREVAELDASVARGLLEGLGIDPAARAEVLAPTVLVRLYSALA